MALRFRRPQADVAPAAAAAAAARSALRRRTRVQAQRPGWGAGRRGVRPRRKEELQQEVEEEAGVDGAAKKMKEMKLQNKSLGVVSVN